MITTIKRSSMNDNYLTVNIQAMTTGKLLATLQALKDSKSAVAYDVYMSFRHAMMMSRDLEIQQALKIFEDLQKKDLHPA